MERSDALISEPALKVDYVLANPPFGKKSSMSFTNAEGEEDERLFTIQDANQMRSYLPAEVWGLLVEKMQQLSLASAYFKGLTDAGFLPKY